jgi:hypothetical protein
MQDILTYEGVSKSFRTGCLDRELQMVQLSATRCSCIAILWVSLLRFDAMSLCVASQRVFIVVSVFHYRQSVTFGIHPRISCQTIHNILTSSENAVRFVSIQLVLLEDYLHQWCSVAPLPWASFCRRKIWSATDSKVLIKNELHGAESFLRS